MKLIEHHGTVVKIARSICIQIMHLIEGRQGLGVLLAQYQDANRLVPGGNRIGLETGGGKKFVSRAEVVTFIPMNTPQGHTQLEIVRIAGERLFEKRFSGVSLAA